MDSELLALQNSELCALQKFVNTLDMADVLDDKSPAVVVKTEEPHDATSGESGEDDTQQPPPAVTTARSTTTSKQKRVKTASQRKRQLQYGLKYCLKRKNEKSEIFNDFTVGLKTLNELLPMRIQKTAMAAEQLRGLGNSVDVFIKVEGGVDARNDLKLIEFAKTQLELNSRPIKCIADWAAEWKIRKQAEYGKNFLKSLAPAMELLIVLGTELDWANRDLEQCLIDKTGAVWV